MMEQLLPVQPAGLTRHCSQDDFQEDAVAAPPARRSGSTRAAARKGTAARKAQSMSQDEREQADMAMAVAASLSENSSEDQEEVGSAPAPAPKAPRPWRASWLARSR